MKIKRILSMLLAASLVAVTAAGCGNNATTSSAVSSAPESSAPASSAVDSSEVSSTASEVSSQPESEGITMPGDYDAKSAEAYNAVLGDFKAAYDVAVAETDVSMRYALMAIAEAKLMESGTQLPTTNNGARPQISRLAPYTTDYAQYGSDGDRYHSGLVTTEPIKTADWEEMKAKWAEVKGTGTYHEWAKTYLTDKGYTLKDTFGMAYTGEPEHWDVLASSRATVGQVLCNTYDPLLEHDCEGTLQPALAESYEMSADGLTYTFKIRQGVKWVDSQGREVGEVKADDWVASMQHLMDAKAGLESLLYGKIKNAQAYVNGEITDFAEVGVTAQDDYTLVFTLDAPCTYFTTMLGYSIFAPMSRSYYESQGGTFGAQYEESGSGNYGTSPDTVAYCGPYLVTNYTPDNKIVFSANESYWNPDNVTIKTITWTHNDGSDTTRYYTDLKEGVTDSNSLNSSNYATAKTDGWWDQYGHVSNAGSTTYSAFMNINRNAYYNFNSSTEAVSPQSEEERARTKEAILNPHFRRAVFFSLDRVKWNAQSIGDDFGASNLRNSYTPGNFVALEKDITVDINGTPTEFKAGTYYGAIMQAQLDADQVAIKVWDPTLENGLGSGDGYDGWYNVENAKAELATAVEELASLNISAENPIQLDLPYPAQRETNTNAANVFKQSVEAATDGMVQINLVKCDDDDQWYNTGYYTSYGYEANFDLFDLSGWGPDYGDPSTFLDTFLPDYAGYVCKSLGIY